MSAQPVPQTEGLEVASLFPFHFTLDSKMALVNCGPGFGAACPSFVAGVPVAGLLKPRHSALGFDFASLCAAPGATHLLDVVDAGLTWDADSLSLFPAGIGCCLSATALLALRK